MAVDQVGLRYVSEGLEETLQGIQRYNKAVEGAGQKSKQASGGREAAQNFRQTGQQAERTGRTMRNYGQQAQGAATAQGLVRQQMLATANSIAVLDGPLGGIASRFSAFGVLVGRTGIALGAAAVAFSTLTFQVSNAIRAFADMETQTLVMNRLLQTTGRDAVMTGQQLEGMAQRIASATLASTQQVRTASNQLLTFRKVSEDVFEDVLVLAQDMAQLGFGTLESEAVKLAKAIEDPRQSLTSLSRSGITFTLEQRRVIQSLVDTGREAEATRRILETVDRQVGGSGAAAAEGFAGSVDSISQSLANLREFVGREALQFDWSLILPNLPPGTDVTIENIIRGLGDGAAAMNEARVQTDEAATAAERLERVNQRLIESFDDLARLDPDMGQFRPALHQEINVLLDQRDRLRREAAAQSAQGALQRSQELAREVDELQLRNEQRVENIGLLQQERELEEGLAKLGLAGPQLGLLRDAQKERASALIVQGQQIERQRDYLRGLEREKESMRERTQMQEILNSLHGEPPELIDLMAQRQMIFTRSLEDGVRPLTDIELHFVTVLDNMISATRESMRLSAETEKAAQEADRLADAAQRAASALAGIGDALVGTQTRLAGIRAELVALGRGAGTPEQMAAGAVARRRAEIEAAGGRVGPHGQAAEDMDELYRSTLDLHRAEEQLREGRRAASGTSGGSAGGATPEDVETLGTIVARMDEQISRERQLLELTGQQRTERQIYFELIDQLRSQDIAYTEEAVAGAAERMAARQEENNLLREQQRMQERVASSLGGMFHAATKGADSFKNALAGVLDSLSRMLANSAFQGLLSGTSLGGALGDLGSALFGNANGNAFAGGNVIPFATGGVVNRPTTFPMAGSRTGLMGEAGPEAIMPLKRGSDGRLGVTAQSGASGAGQVQVSRVRIELGEGLEARLLDKAANQSVEIVRQDAKQNFNRRAQAARQDPRRRG